MVGGRYFIGELVKDVLAMPGDVFELKKVVHIEVITIPMRAPNGATAFQKEITAEPLLFSWEGSPVLVKPELLSRLSHMEEGDRRRYKKLVADAEKLVTQLRAQDAGVVLPR